MKGKDERYPDYPLFKGLQRPLEFMGIQGRYIYWAAGVARRSHRRIYHRLLPRGFRGRTGRAGCGRLDGYCAYHAQTAERAAYQERRSRSVYLRPLEETVRRKEKPSRATCGLVEC